MKLYDKKYFDDLTVQAKNNPRLRQHSNIHQSFDEPCQRLFNAIEPESYIRPHRHLIEPREELLVAIRGKMAVICFSDCGDVSNISYLGSEECGSECNTAIEIDAHTWHTVIALVPGCMLLEVKSGPFDPRRAKELAAWAPEEGTILGKEYLGKLTFTL